MTAVESLFIVDGSVRCVGVVAASDAGAGRLFWGVSCGVIQA